MGQAWCKEKSSKAQDSKSPLDRVFVRCAHRIYPSLKEEGSVLGGSTQRVTSSEIGYASSPPRSALLRGHSIDSVDRPFHPSEWVDVNLEVPCTPRDSVVLTRLSAITPERFQQRAGSPSNYDSLGPKMPKEEGGGAPVPPPRRRRRRDRRPLPPEPDGDVAGPVGPTSGLDRATAASSSTTLDRDDDDDDDEDDESDDFGLYSQLVKPTSRNPDNDPARNSDDEFVAIEESLKERSLEDVSRSISDLYESVLKPRAADVGPENHGSASLPNYASLAGERTDGAAAAERPPRHLKAASLPHDESQEPSSSSPERTHLRIREDKPSDAPPADSSDRDNSIFKADEEDAGKKKVGVEEEEDCSFGPDVKTSTPVKAASPEDDRSTGHDDDAVAASSASRSLGDALGSFDGSSTSQHDSSVQSANVSADPGAIEEAVGRPASAEPDAPDRARTEDAGYETKSSLGSHLFSDDSGRAAQLELFHDAQELSSGILRDAVVNSSGDELGNPVNGLQRTISEESLPREMLADELDDEEPEARRLELEADKSAKDASNEITRRTSANDSDTFKTPPLSPELKTPKESANTTNGEDSSSSSTAKETANCDDGDEGNPAPGTITSAATSADSTAAPLAEMPPGKRNETTEASDKSPEPQIVPVKQQQQQPPPPCRPEDDAEIRKRDEEDRVIDSPARKPRINPFNDYKSNDADYNLSLEEPPEKPIRLYRINLIEDSSIDEPLIVPTPPRRRHKSKSNLNSSANEVIEAIHTYASNDRLI